MLRINGGRACLPYQPLDVVSIDGNSYVAREANNNKRPHPRSNVWQLLAAKGSKGDRGADGVSVFGPGKDGINAVGGNATLEIEFAGNFAKGQVIYVDDNGIAQLAQANALATTGAVGFVFAENSYITEGQITLDDWSAIAGTINLTPGKVYYLSTSAAGGITNASPTIEGIYVVALGRAVSPTTLDIEIQPSVLL